MSPPNKKNQDQNNNAKTKAPPRLAFCVSWKRIIAMVILVYLVVTAFLYWKLTSAHVSNRNQAEVEFPSSQKHRRQSQSVTHGSTRVGGNSLVSKSSSSSNANSQQVGHLMNLLQGLSGDSDSSSSSSTSELSVWHTSFQESQMKDDVLMEPWYNEKLPPMEDFLRLKLRKPTLVSCRRHAHVCLEQAYRGSLFYFNPLKTHSRIICGKVVPPEHTLKIGSGECGMAAHENGNTTTRPTRSRLFAHVPSHRDAHKTLAPVHLRYTYGGIISARPFDDCNVPCFETGSRTVAVDDRFVEGTEWKLTVSMEGPEIYNRIIPKPDDWRHSQFYATTSFDSDVPMPYFSFAEYNIQTSDYVNFDEAIPGAVFLARDCQSHNDREAIVEFLQSSPHIRIDSLSSCLKNAEPPNGMSLKDKDKIMKQYMFYLAFENQCADDYVTEKLWGPLVAGTIPVYFGAPNVDVHLPSRKPVIINVKDFPNPESLALHLKQVSTNRTLYESYHEWRKEPLAREFLEKYAMVQTHSTCRTCRWAAARMYGLGWNHTYQILQDLHVPRTVCWAGSEGTLTTPVVETWSRQTSNTHSEVSHKIHGHDLHAQRRHAANMVGTKQQAITGRTASDGKKPDQMCLQGVAQEEILVDDSKLLRRVIQQDGIVDMEVELLPPSLSAMAMPEDESSSSSSTNPGWIWELRTPLHTGGERVKAGHYRIENTRTRMTLLTWPLSTVVEMYVGHWKVSIPVPPSSSSSASVSVPTLVLKVRLIVEDLDRVHKGATHAENYFGKMMYDDFYQPIETFGEGL